MFVMVLAGIIILIAVCVFLRRVIMPEPDRPECCCDNCPMREECERALK